MPNKTLLANILMVWACVLGLSLPAAAADSALEKKIEGLEKTMNEAYAKNDLDRYFSYYADDLVAIFYNERTTLAAYRKSWTESVKAGNVVTSVNLSDMNVHVLASGKVVVASYQIEVGNRHADGKTTKEKAFETDVWVIRQGEWKVTHAHYALAMPSPG